MMAVNPRLAIGLSLSLLSGLGCGAAGQAAIEIGPPGAEAVSLGGEARGSTPGVKGPGCAWTGHVVTPRGEGMPLCFAVDGACFAQAISPFVGDATVTLPEGKPMETGARVELLDNGVRVAAWTSGDAVYLFAEEPLLFGPAAVVIGSPGLFVERVHSGSLDLSFRGDASVKLRSGAWRSRAPCPALGLAKDAYDPAGVLSAAGVTRAHPSDRLLPVDEAVEVSATQGGAPILEIMAPSEEAARVEVVEERAGQSRVLWWQADGGLVFGWVDTGVLAPAPPRPEPTSSSANGPSIAALSQPLAGMRCPVDVTLFASVAGTLAEAGTIVAATRFDATPSVSTEYTKIRLRAHHFESMPDSDWLVRTAELQACKVE